MQPWLQAAHFQHVDMKTLALTAIPEYLKHHCVAGLFLSLFCLAQLCTSQTDGHKWQRTTVVASS